MDAIEKRALDQLAQLLQSGGFEGELRVGREFGKALVAEIAALTPPEGYVLLPFIPSYEMTKALADTAGCNLACAALAYRDALAARPEVKL
ncbi:hypothetical protein [Stenotrophomonas maltophilia]|uniref:hypothetical protein n=1 Tax=Stenotrophomonas maltophilia TaxID=40324 RepID=UPI0013DB49AF|nr:hypothetical protein [Stenotrophomonas maltophilia]